MASRIKRIINQKQMKPSQKKQMPMKKMPAKMPMGKKGHE
jgi:hypothetical protein